MNTTQRKRLLKLADFIVEQVPKEKFDMSSFGLANGPIDSCGSAGCALGWATVLFRRLGVAILGGAPRYKDLTGYGVGVTLFGLTYGQSEELFSIEKGCASAKQVRRDILRLVAKLDKEKLK